MCKEVRDIEPLTRRRKLRIQPLRLDALQAQTRAHERQRDERQRVRPARVRTLVRDALLAALPQDDRRDHGEERLDDCADEEPQAGEDAEGVAPAADEGAGVEGDERREGLSVGDVKAVVTETFGAFEEAGEGEGELGGGVRTEIGLLEISDSPGRSYRFGTHTRRISQRRRLHLCIQYNYRFRGKGQTIERKSLNFATHMNPVMKQNAARGVVHSLGSTSDCRYVHSELDWAILPPSSSLPPEFPIVDRECTEGARSGAASGLCPFLTSDMASRGHFQWQKDRNVFSSELVAAGGGGSRITN